MYKVGPGVQRGAPHQQPRHAGRKGTGGQGRKGTGAGNAGTVGLVQQVLQGGYLTIGNKGHLCR